VSPTEVVKWCELVNSQEWIDKKQVGSRKRKTKKFFVVQDRGSLFGQCNTKNNR
jgi:hypothetical protein